MKKIILLLMTAVILTSCGTGLSSRPEKQPLIIKSYLDNFLAENPSCTNNEITLKDASRKLRKDFTVSMLGDSTLWLTELPVTFERVAEYTGNGDYLVQFEHRSGQAGFSVSQDYNITFKVLAITDKNTATELLKDRRYNISGSSINFANHSDFIWPGWSYDHDYTNISTYTSKGDPNIYLGAFLVENLNFSLIDNYR